MFSDKRLLTGGIVSGLAVEWILIALVTRNGFGDLFFYLGPGALLALAVAWLFFTFAGRLFSWSRAAVSVILGAAVVTPLLAYAFSTSKDPDLMAKFIFLIAVGWAASFGGTLWNVTGAARDALREWRLDRQAQRARRIYVPA
jgi:hypothetical protein